MEVFPLALTELIHRKKEDVFFIQAGAHDGLTYDPMRPFIDEYNLGTAPSLTSSLNLKHAVV
ncbi:MAG: hypothetical protein WKF37_14655 [Bryobacteraceae bacterium]